VATRRSLTIFGWKRFRCPAIRFGWCKFGTGHRRNSQGRSRGNLPKSCPFGLVYGGRLVAGEPHRLRDREDVVAEAAESAVHADPESCPRDLQRWSAAVAIVPAVAGAATRRSRAGSRPPLVRPKIAVAVFPKRPYECVRKPVRVSNLRIFRRRRA
jgi:hypothetical protein